MAQYTCYCDGSYSPARNQSGSGVVIMKGDTKVASFCKGYDGGTNNTGELNAIILAMKCFVNKVDSIEIISDSQYCINTILGKFQIKANHQLWEKFFETYKKLQELCPNIQFSWVKGHDTCDGNNQADKLAVKASQLI